MPKTNKMNKRKMEIYLMVGALLLLFVGIPAAVWMANSVNGYLSANPTYAQIENTTAFLDAPLIADEIDTEYSFASVNGTDITEETPTWDVDGDWDEVTLTANETRNLVMFNVNMTVRELLNTDYSALRLKLNGTNELKVTIYAVKSDGVLLTKSLAYQFVHVGNETQTLLWNFTPSTILGLQVALKPALTDVVYFQIVIEGYNAANALTTGDTIQFQFAWAGSAAAYSFTSWQILTGVSSMIGICLMFVAMASTPYWNPLSGKGRASSSGSAPPARRKAPRRKASRRRR